jgi:hypothetical protein
VADERHPSTLVEVLQGLGKGLQDLSRSPAFAALVDAELNYRKRKEQEDNPPAFLVQPDAVIEVDGFPEPIDLIHLRRTIANAERSLKRYIDADASEPASVSRATARNYLIRTYRSMQSLAWLLRAHELSSPFQDAVNEMTSSSAENTDDEHLSLTLAEVYRRVKTLKTNMANPINTHYSREDIEAVVSDLEAILFHISKNAIKMNGDQDG